MQTFVQRTVPKGMQGRAFANLFGAVGLSAGLSYAIGGPLLDLTGPRILLTAGGWAGAVVAVIVARRLARVVRQTTEVEPVVSPMCRDSGIPQTGRVMRRDDGSSTT